MRISDWSSDVCSSDLYVSKDAQYGACIDTHVKGRLGPVEGLFDLNPVLPEQCRDRAVGTLRKDKRAITTAIQITDEAQNRNTTAPDSISGEGETDRRWFTVYHGPTSSPLCISRPHCCAPFRRVPQQPFPLLSFLPFLPLSERQCHNRAVG